ncbi:pyrroline-5-carboxylate reductase [Sphingomonas daechungensis]|uniref:pyrroline-5-carboxylate reductase family protein n=1 Tax=Sphingomonas daechungensis TaxID=1176646 RepID=UPI0031E71952
MRTGRLKLVLNPIWFIGCGNIAGAMVEGWQSANVDLSDAVVIRPSAKPVPGLRVTSNYAAAGPAPRLVILGCKPQQLDDVVSRLTAHLTSQTLVVSLLVGVELETLRQKFWTAGAIVRALPNLPVAVRRGVIALYGEDIPGELHQEVSQLFAQLGYALWVNNESSLAAVGSVAGAGPAYVASFVEALAKAGVERGLSSELAATVALETVLGTAWMAASTHESMGDVVRRVASPNGTTEAGLAVLRRDDVLDKLVSLTVSAASRRAAELAEEAKGPKLAQEAPSA